MQWATRRNGTWHEFMSTELALIDDSGVYIIWIDRRRVVYVGQGDVAERLQEHRDDPRFAKLDRWSMCATWASVSPSQRDGVEKFLASTLNPVIGEQWPSATPIQVNLPWNAPA